MEIKAFVVENEVCNILNFAENHPLKNRYFAGLSSNPIYIDSSNFSQLAIGNYYNDGIFYSDENMQSPLQETGNTLNTENNEITSIALISNNKVFGILHFSSLSPHYETIVSGMLSNPICMDATNYPEIEIGWLWNGQDFIAPNAN